MFQSRYKENCIIITSVDQMKNKLFGPSINQAHDLLFSKKFSKMEYCIFHWVTQDISENKILSKFL